MKRVAFVVLMLLVIAGGCLPAGPITISPFGESPTINSFDASPLTISAGESSTLSWKVSGATNVKIDQGIGNVALTGTRAVTPSATTIYTLIATNSSGASATATAQVIVSGASPPSPSLPVVNSFTANPPSLIAGNWTTLSWNVLNATSVTIDQGIGTVASSGTTSVSPIATTTYTLTATNAAGNTTQMTQVIVSGAPPPPTDTTPPTVPVTLLPSADATLTQPETTWTFDWADSSDPESGIKQYQLYVIRSGAITPAIDVYVTTSGYSDTLGGHIGHDSLTNWTWKVRAQNNAGLWSDWSPTKVFNVEPKITGVLDITQTGTGASAVFGWSSSYVNVGQGQSFTVTQAGWFDEFQIYLSSSQPTSTSDVIRCDLRDAAGTVLQSVTVAGFASGPARWVNFDFGSQKYITPATYYCTCYVVSPATNHWYSIHGDPNNASYPGGGRYTSTGGSPQNWETWFSNPWDLTFKVKILVGP